MAEGSDKPPHVDANGTTDTATVVALPNDAPEAVATKADKHDVDLDAQEMVIASLRTQVQDLFTQVTQLNSKLVNSYDRVSDLEDDLHAARTTLKNSNVRISQLEMERTQHLAALNTGLLVEKSHVTTELNRLMEKATEEAAQRGQAESARAAIEKDLDDLSASLFDQANTMVAEARFAQHLSEQKVVQAQQALKGAEEAVSIMQTQMQQLQAEKEEAEKNSQELQARMGKGKWLERIQTVDLSKPMRLMSSHLPYQEFLLFVAHLRSLHQTSLHPPAMTTILPLPFLARLASEDSEQTLRLDLAPSLNWLSRRSVQSAIHTGQLTIEPISVSTLLAESSYTSPVTVAGLNNNNDNVPCALCGSSITTVTDYLQTRAQRPHSLGWSGSFFKRQSTTSNHGAVSPTQSITTTGPISNSSGQSSLQQIYIFRVAPQQSTSISSSLPIPSSIAKSLSQGSTPSSNSPPHLSPMNGIAHSPSGSGNQSVTIYPLCSSGWCLRRLRSTCTMWAFVRTGIVERVWEEELPSLPPPLISTAVPSAASASSPATPSDAKPPVPPRKRGLWGFATAIGERAASWSDSDKKKTHTPANSIASPINGSPPPPVPPRRDSAVGRRLSPASSSVPTPPPRSHPPVSQSESHTSVASTSAPPPLPPRSEGRRKTPPTPRPLDLNGETPNGQQEDPTHSVPTTPTNKLLFDADSHQSPLKHAKLPLPSVEDVVVPPTSATSEGKDKHPASAETPANPATSAQAPASPVKLNRLSLARSTPLPDSRPATPSQTNAVNPPSRTASPVIAIVPTGSNPPPVPRRAAARRPAPVPPPSRPATPQKPAEVKTDTPEKDKVTVEKTETDKVQVDGQIKEQNGKGAESSEAVDKVMGTAVEGERTEEEKKEEISSDATKEIFEDAKSQPPTPAAVSEAAEPSTIIPTSDLVATIDEETATKESAAIEETESVTDGGVDRSTQSTPDVFVDAVSTAPAPKAPSPEEAELPAELPKVRSTTTETSRLPSPVPKSISNKDSPIGGDREVVASPTRELKDEKDEDEEADPNDKEVYIGDATWEERSWKELVRLREEMFWARIGGSR